MNNNADVTLCGNIRFAHEAICEMDGAEVLASIPRADIAHLTFAVGRSAARPLRQGAAGLVSCAIGLFWGVIPLSDLVLGLLSGEPIRISLYTIRRFAYASPLMLIGLWLLWGALRKSSYLLVHTTTGEKKLSL